MPGSRESRPARRPQRQRPRSRPIPRGRRTFLSSALLVRQLLITAGSLAAWASPAGTSRGAVMPPVHAIAVPVGKGVWRVSREGAFERAESDARSRAGAPAKAADLVIVVERAAILHRRDGCGGRHGCRRRRTRVLGDGGT